MVYTMSDPKLLDGVQTVHFIGCGGSGTYPLIQILQSQGYAITGSDVEETKNTEAERALGVRVFIGHDAANVGNAQLVRFTVRSWRQPRAAGRPCPRHQSGGAQRAAGLHQPQPSAERRRSRARRTTTTGTRSPPCWSWPA